MGNKNGDYDRLFDQWISGKISPDECIGLLDSIENDPDLLNRLRMNVLSDFLLTEHFELLKKRQRNWEDQCVKGSVQERISDDHADSLSLDELIVLQNSLSPIQKEEAGKPEPLSLTRRILLSVKNGIYPDKQTRDESIAPVISVIILIFFLITGLFFWLEKEELDPASNSPLFMARVSEVINPVWADHSMVYKRGQLIDGQSLFSLRSGLVQLMMNNGTSLIMEGPIELSVGSPMNAFCQSGKVSVRVSDEAKGYELSTPFGSVIDRGTEFFVDVGINESHTQVLKGKVDINRQGFGSIPLIEGSEISFQRDKKETINSIRKPLGLSLDHFIQLASLHQQELKTQREAREEELDRSLNLIARFSGNDQHNQIIPNASIQGKNICTSLQLTNCGTGSGSLDHTRSIQFERRQSKGAFTLNGKYQSLTFTVSLRLSKLSDQGEMILSSDKFLEEPGTCQWKILGSGEICLFLTDPDKRQFSFRTDPCIYNRDCNTWLHLAVVLDEKEKTITHYRDGLPVKTLPWTNVFPLILNNTTVGNIQNESLVLLNRCFNGAIEELQIWDRALTREEIENISQ